MVCFWTQLLLSRDMFALEAQRVGLDLPWR